jgi:tetratricopeptide (TPR) repeat protein
MNYRRALALAAIVGALPAGGAFGEAPPAAAADPETPPSAALALAKEGRQLLKAKQLSQAVAKLREAVQEAAKEKLEPEEQAALHYLYALCLLRADKDEQALAELQTAVTLDPKDTEVRVLLAAQLLDGDQPARAAREAELALQQGIADKEDLETAHKVVKDARSQLLHDRLDIGASVSFGFDSNVLQGGPIIQIANKSLRGQRATRALGKAVRNGIPLVSLALADRAFTIANYTTPSPETSEWDLPLSLDFDVAGRLLGRSQVELWLGYRFQQTIMTASGFEHDAYNFQQHDVPLRLELRPARWSFIRLKAQGFVNFTGLVDFSPYQGGLNAGLELWFTESRRWKTRLLYEHQLRRSFNQSADGYLNGDRDEVRLVQELRLRGKQVAARGSLGYRFRAERSGVFFTTQDLNLDTNLTMQAPPKGGNCIPLFPAQPCTYPALVTDENGQNVVDPATGKFEVGLGYYSYNAPLSYFSHELSTRWTVTVPRGVELLASFSWEYLSYPDPYTATFTQLLVPVDNADVGNWPLNPRTTVLKMPEQQRTDSRFTVLAGLTKKLPHDLGLGLTYTFTKNLSTIANYVDNRSYEKHLVQLAGEYSF